MSLPPPRRLATYVRASVDVPRVNRLWIQVKGTRPSRPATRWVLLGLVAATFVLLAVWLRRSPVAVPMNAVASNAVERPGTMTLPDGSQVLLLEGSDLRLDRADSTIVEVTLRSGEASFTVRHDPSRTFIVHVGAYDVVDVGTRFHVSRSVTSVSVAVDEGRVEVRDSGGNSVRSLGAGESWTSVTTSASATAETLTLDAAIEIAPAATHATPSSVQAPSAKELLESANDARLNGDVRTAAARYDLVRKRYRADPRAGLAAFELGRLRLDSLSDASGAVEAFDDAIALSPGSWFREYAEARRVEALDVSGERARCVTARDAYLARYPSGVHTTLVSSRCRP